MDFITKPLKNYYPGIAEQKQPGVNFGVALRFCNKNSEYTNYKYKIFYFIQS